MRKAFGWICFVALLAVGAYALYANHFSLNNVVRLAEEKVQPCSSPITYSLGSIDQRFGIATDTVVADLKEAETIWEQPSGKDLFEYEPAGGEVTVSFVYDDRQAATDKLSSMGIQVDQSKASYDSLKAKYDVLDAKIASEKSAYESDARTYQEDQDAYNAKVEASNKAGGATPSQYQEFQSERNALTQEYAQVKSEETRLNDDIDTLNALATAINQLIVQLNLNVQQYNQTGASLGEFEEGLYEQDGPTRTISIYEYTDHASLVRVLAHEMGHSLGMEHVADAGSIMYKVNQGDSLTATPADLTELARICGTATR